MLHTTQIYLLSSATNLSLKVPEDGNIEFTADDFDGLSSSRAWQDILSRTQVYNKKKKVPDFGISKYIQSPYHLATLHFPKGIRSVTVPFTKLFQSTSTPSIFLYLRLVPFIHILCKNRNSWLKPGLIAGLIDLIRLVPSALHTFVVKNTKKSLEKTLPRMRYSSTSILIEAFRYAQVQFYFFLQYIQMTMDWCSFYWPQLLQFLWQSREIYQRLITGKKTQITVINLDDLTELVGLVKRNENTYVVY